MGETFTFRLGLACLLFSWSAQGAVAQPFDEQRVGALVAELGSQEFDKRQAAEDALLKFGRSVDLAAALERRLAVEDDAEIRLRLQRVIAAIEPEPWLRLWKIRNVSVVAGKRPLKHVLADLSAGTQKNFLLADDRDGEIPVTLSGSNVRSNVSDFAVLQEIAHASSLEIDGRGIRDNLVYLVRSPKVSLKFINASIRDVLGAWSIQSNRHIVFGPDVKGAFSIDLQEVPASRALQEIARAAHLHVVPESGDIWRISSRCIPVERAEQQGLGLLEVPNSLEVKELPLKKVLDYLAAMTGKSFRTESGELRISFCLHRATCTAILSHITHKYGLAIETEAGGGVIVDSPIKVSMIFNNAHIRDVINTIAIQAERNVVLDAALEGTISLRVENVPWHDAMNAAVKAVGGTIEKEPNNTLHIRRPKEAP